MQQFTKGLPCFLLFDFPLGSPILSHCQPQYALILSFASNNLLSVPISVKMQFLPFLWILIMYSHLFRLYRLERPVFVFVIFHLNLPLYVFLVLRETFPQYVILFLFFLFFLSCSTFPSLSLWQGLLACSSQLFHLSFSLFIACFSQLLLP